MKSRTMLAGLAVVVVAGILALILAVRSGSEAGSTGRSADSRSPDTHGVEPAEAHARPRLPAQPDAEEPTGPAVDVDEAGTLVRDHRKHVKAPLAIHPVRRPKAIGKVDTGTILDVRTSLRPIVKKCAAGIDASAMGDNPRAQTVATVTIADGVLTVNRVEVQLADVEDDNLAECIKKAALDIRVDAPGHAAVSEYPLTHPFRLRR